MTLPNRERILVSLTREIANEGGYELSTFSQDWILRLERSKTTRHIFGYNFEINSATARLVAADKAATAALLSHSGVAHVEHRLFLHPDLAGYVSGVGNWDLMQSFAGKTGYPLVVKPNEGTGGEHIFRVENALGLERAVGKLFERERAICLSPFLEIAQEFRVIVLDEDCVLIYAKKRPCVVGDGQSTVLELIEQLHLQSKLSQNQAEELLREHDGDLKHVLDEGQELVIGWRHNLAGGARPEIITKGELYDELAALAQEARSAINIRFASVDIVEVEGSRSVLEINAGVMMEYFTRNHPQERSRVKAIYAKAIDRMFSALG